VANALVGAGFGPGDSIGIVAPNSFDMIRAGLGIIKSGCTICGITMMAGDNDITYILEHAGIKLVFADESIAERISGLRANSTSLRTIVSMGPKPVDGCVGLDKFLSGYPKDVPHANARPDDNVLIVYTGGTTGKPKGVVHTQSTFAFAMLAHDCAVNWTADDKFLIMTPLTHGAGALMYAGMMMGCRFVIEKQFDPFKILDLIENERVTKVFLVPTLIYILLDMLKQKSYNLSSLNAVLYGASPIQANKLAEAIEKFGPVLVQVYGQVECPNLISTLTIEDHVKAMKNPKLLQSCGRPNIMASVRLLDDSGTDVPEGEIGEICARAPYVMKGYLNQPEINAKTISSDGWLHTGDMGKFDSEGYLYIVDRKKDMIISGGMNVYPAEVEAVISQHPKVKQVAVIAVPDDRWGESVTAVVVPDGEVAEKEIKEFCRGKLAKYAQPKTVVFQQNIPLTALGKIDKKAIKAPYWEGRERAVS
jgi:fatty-acyl-CoA synthase/long-chain acyl-CoA synthetase